MTRTPFRRSASAVLLVSATALAGCATDFGLQEISTPDAMGDDTAAPLPEEEEAQGKPRASQTIDLPLILEGIPKGSL